MNETDSHSKPPPRHLLPSQLRFSDTRSYRERQPPLQPPVTIGEVAPIARQIREVEAMQTLNADGTTRDLLSSQLRAAAENADKVKATANKRSSNYTKALLEAMNTTKEDPPRGDEGGI